MRHAIASPPVAARSQPTIAPASGVHSYLPTCFRVRVLERGSLLTGNRRNQDEGWLALHLRAHMMPRRSMGAVSPVSVLRQQFPAHDRWGKHAGPVGGVLARGEFPALSRPAPRSLRELFRTRQPPASCPGVLDPLHDLQSQGPPW